MATAILVTKLYVPPPPSKVVLRPRLMERLNEGLHRKLTLISAPAGFGKTTLVSEWVAGCGRPAAWLSLDEGDSDPARFLTYLVAALQTVSKDIGTGVLGAIQSSQPPAAIQEFLLATLLNEIAAIPNDFILVLDDYHHIDSEPIDHALAFLLDHLPPQMHLVIATREDPSLPLPRYRARGQLTELRAADLRFTPAEAADFLNRVMALTLSAEDIAALETRTEGWIAGLQLAALSMQGREDVAGFIQAFTGSHHFVLDYLLEEVLYRQTESVLAFLLRTSILERMCGPLCEAIFPNSPGQQTLELLERANLFIVPLDNERRWYRYHHLFADLLRLRLRQNFSPGDIATLHIRASEWYEQNDLLLQAFHHALTAEEFARAARLAEDVWEGMERNFQTAAWLGWAKKLPGAVVYSRPKLCVHLGEAFSDVGDLESSERYLKYAERALVNVPNQDEAEALPGNIALIRASNAQNKGDLTDTVRYAELAIQLIPKENAFLLAQAVITLGFTHWAAGNLEASLRAMHAWMDDMERLGNETFVVASAFAVADMQVILGRLNDAEKSLRQAIQQAVPLGPEAEPVTAHHHLGLALLAHERGDEAAAIRHLDIAADLGQRTTLIDWQHRWNLAQARLKESAGEWDAALGFLDEAGRVYVKNPIPIMQPSDARKARVYLKQGRLGKAQAWARERGQATTDEAHYLAEYELLTLARVRLAEGSFSGVDDLLERLLALAETQKRTGSVIEILLTQALVHQAQGNRLHALAALERALALAEPEGYLRAFVDEGEAMRRLLRDFRPSDERQAAQSLRRYADRIVKTFSRPNDSISQATITTLAAELIEPLTDRELEIIRLIADGKSNREISQRLYLALSTVKGHNLRIFDKLQAQNRTEAVARARELGLL
jgi:LuxR family maltose regulon positive regulatory protein